jgi:hypothetical protein
MHAPADICCATIKYLFTVHQQKLNQMTNKTFTSKF